MASAQIRHFYNTPTTISSTTTRQPLLQQQQQLQQHTNNCNSKRKQFQSDTFLCHTQTQSESEAKAAGATLCQSTLAAAATTAKGAGATGARATATDDVQASECRQSWTTDEIAASNRNTQHRMRYPLAGSAATCDVATVPAARQQQQQQCLAPTATALAASTGTSEQDRLATSTCLSRLSSKVSQDSTKQQRKLFQHGATTRDSDASTSTAPAVSILMDMQKFARSIFPLVIIFNLLPLFYAGTFARVNQKQCDQTFVSRIGGPQNGSFSAPLLHNHRNHSRQCLYTFLAGPGQRVEVVFKSFNLRGSPPDGSAVGELPSCVHEYMDIYSEVQSSEPAELINSPFGGRYCGTIPPRRRISMYRAVAISFFSNKNVTTDLFEGTFRFINASEYEIGIPIAGSPCSYTITPSMSVNKTGALISPTYPGAYPKDMSCTYQFLGESNQRVRLEFRDFDLFFGGPHCPFDYVKVYDGPDNSSALIGTYCGQQRNLVLYSSESSLFVHFYTLSRTANTQNRGFKGIYEFSESFVKLDFIRENDGIHIRGSECDQKILSKKESTGFVLSPNYPYPYIPKTVCRYFIYGMQDAQHLERVRLEFNAFNIPKVEHKDKSESNCTDGYLKIYLKGQETADAYDKFDYELCGNETQRVISEGPRLAMVFSSGELQGRGFKGKYTFETEYKIPGTAAPDGTCSFTYVSNSKKRGELNSPRYPSNYPSDTNCSYLFLAEADEQVTIVFDHFKIKADNNANATAGAYGSGACFEDWLEMYVVYRDNNDRLLGRYCGQTAPGPVESPRGAVGLRITLHTDQESVASGFKARYFFESAKSDAGDCGGNFSNQDSGLITSPNWPAGYKAPGRGMASNACNWVMKARPGYKLSIHFEQFGLEGDPANRGCPAAVLRLWMNVDSDQPPMELCGEKPPVEQWHYTSTGQTARISFTTSDKTVGAQGFRIVWTEIQDSGPGPPSVGLHCESTYHFQCGAGYCISDKLRCDGVKNCGPGDDTDELHCTTEAAEEDYDVLIIITLLVVSSLICLLCILCHSRRNRRNHVRQLGLHRNAHYDSQTSATAAGLSSSRRHLQSGGASIAGSLHGINSGNLMIPPAPLPPTSVPPPPHICIAGVDMGMGMGMGHGLMSNGEDDEDDLELDEDQLDADIFINDVHFDEDNIDHVNQMANV
ncbi:cubilin isoform X1 [Drosophila rhopaloa]|uniref:Cubilin isoform X1 n=1 Tax=Drosophila rhopaloa TaxID=1041015 RepID=A0A6P4FIB6_DRORH|nr:cubilin isoform X1 [Drosophila rhopaloa]XP_016985081.1 cubilin isoform X1 [Drosophila rhopaloa]XP_016985082.1 cubilin isoform X1 [Drosophila rhopaloa]